MIGNYHQHWLWIHCRCGHVGKVSMFEMCIKYGKDYPIDRVIAALRCGDCGDNHFEGYNFSADMRWLSGNDEWAIWSRGWDSRIRAWPVVFKSG